MKVHSPTMQAGTSSTILAADAQPSGATWHDGVDALSKTVLALAGALFAVGMIIDNIQLQRIGIHDVSVAQPRFVLVGVAFFTYLLIPALLFGLPALTVRWLRQLLYGAASPPRKPVWRWFWWLGRTMLLLLAGAAVFLTLLLVVLPSPFLYFVERLRWSGSTLILAARGFSSFSASGL